ncbi:MAG TPA: glycosyltransferase [Firmicutes bacterium]|nr:glycosyltransferase [Bacillota bacterium]
MIYELEYKTCYLDGRLGRARDILRKLIAEHPDCAAFHADLALVYLKQGRIAEAREEANQCAASVDHPARPEILTIAGFVRESIGDYEGALRLYEQAEAAMDKRRLWIKYAADRVREKLSGHSNQEKSRSVALIALPRLRITYFLDSNLKPDALNVIYEHVNHLTARGHTVYVLSRPGRPEGLEQELERLSAEVIRVPIREELYERAPDSDVVVATSWRTAFDAARVHGAVPFYLVQPSPELELTNGAGGADAQASKNLEASFMLPLRLIAPSDYVRYILKTRYNRRASVVPYGVDLNAFQAGGAAQHPCDEKEGQCHDGQSPNGNQDADASSFSGGSPAPHAVKRVYKVLVVGSDEEAWMETAYGALRDVMERRAGAIEIVRISPSRRLDFSVHVASWFERPSREDLVRIYSEADIFLSGSPEGASSQAALQAMASDLPVIVCDDGGREGCFIIPPGDRQAMARAIETLIDDEGLRARLAASARRVVQDYDWDAVIERLEEVLYEGVTDVQMAYPSALALGLEIGNGSSEGKSGRVSGKARPTLSLCMIVKNEERFLARCLDSVKDVVDEMIIVDTGSTDRTVEIAKSYGAKVYFHEWKNDFAEARNASLEKATGDWILVMDADEVLAPGMYHVIHRLVNGRQRAIYCARISNQRHMDEGSPLFEHFMNRLFPSDPNIRFVGVIHERVVSLSHEPLPIHNILDFVILHIGYKGEVLISRKKHLRNLTLLKQSISQFPSDPYYHYSLGGTYYELGKVNLAIDELSKAYELCKKHLGDGMSKAIAVSTLCMLSNIVSAFGGRDLAESYLREALDISPTNPDILYYLAEIARMKTEWEKAKVLYIKTLDHKNGPLWSLVHDPAISTWKPWVGLGVCQTALGDYDQAYQSFKKAVHLCPTTYELLGPLSHVRNYLSSINSVSAGPLRSWVNEFVNHNRSLADEDSSRACSDSRVHGGHRNDIIKNHTNLGLSEFSTYLKAYRSGKIMDAQTLCSFAALLKDAGRLNDAFRVYRDALNLEPTNKAAIDALLELVEEMRSGLR